VALSIRLPRSAYERLVAMSDRENSVRELARGAILYWLRKHGG